MGPKQIMGARVKKSLAFIIDIIILIFTLSLISSILSAIVEIYSSPTAVQWSAGVDNLVRVLLMIAFLFLVYTYFIFLPGKIGNTLGRKAFKIQDKFSFPRVVLPKEEKFPGFSPVQTQESRVVTVIVKDGWWVCPSCNEVSSGGYSACNNCGQAVEKVKA